MHFTIQSTFCRIAPMSQPSASSDFPNAGRKSSGFAKRLIKRFVKSLAALALFAVVGLMVLFGLLWREHKTKIALPPRSGHFAVGRTTYTLVNNAGRRELWPLS